MLPPDDPPNPENDPSWLERTHVSLGFVKRTSTGTDCLVVIYTREAKGPLGKRFALDATAGDVSIGRDIGNLVVLDYESVSRRHARLERRDGEWWVVDNNSTNGTAVNDVSKLESVLRNGDQIQIGDVILKYLSGTDMEAEFMSTISQVMITDGLTLAHNKRHLLEQLDNEITRSSRHARPLGLIMFDIDHFKNVNDTYGHLAGDHVLKEVSLLVRGRIRRHETFCRYGGEEFALLLPETNLRGTSTLAEEIRVMVAGHPFRFDGHAITITVSLGATEWTPTIRTAEEFIKSADTRLYQAKNAGRNRVVFA